MALDIVAFRERPLAVTAVLQAGGMGIELAPTSLQLHCELTVLSTLGHLLRKMVLILLRRRCFKSSHATRKDVLPTRSACDDQQTIAGSNRKLHRRRAHHVSSDGHSPITHASQSLPFNDWHRGARKNRAGLICQYHERP